MQDEDQRTVWCGNLSEKVTEEVLYELFLQAGPLDKVRIPKDKDGRQRNFGFITYKHECSVAYAIQLFEGIALFRKMLNLQTRNVNVENTRFLQNVDAQRNHHRSLSCPSSSINSLNFENLNPLAGLIPAPLPSPFMMNHLYPSQQNEVYLGGSPVMQGINSLAHSSLRGTWNRGHPYMQPSERNRNSDRLRPEDNFNAGEPPAKQGRSEGRRHSHNWSHGHHRRDREDRSGSRSREDGGFDRRSYHRNN